MFTLHKIGIYLVITLIIGYFIKNLLAMFTISENMSGWIAISLMGPVLAKIMSKSTYVYIAKSCFLYNQTYNSEIHVVDVIEGLLMYTKKYSIWSSGTRTKIISNRSSVWWDDDEHRIHKFQTISMPSGLIIFRYKNNYLLAEIPEPTINGKNNENNEITLWSFLKIDWVEFMECVQQDYFDASTKKKKITHYKVDGAANKRIPDIMDRNPNTSIKICFGNPSKEMAWNLVLDFLTPSKKNLYKQLGQSYKTSFLIHGPPGTGKSDFVFKLAEHTWTTHQKSVYVVNPRDMDDWDLEYVINNISSGYVLVDEWDFALECSPSNNNDDDENMKGYKREKYPSFRAWASVLDRTKNSIIFWFTTNNLEKLKSFNNGALVRSGRIDHIIEFNSMEPFESRNALKYFHHDEDEVIDQIKDEDLQGLTIATIIKNLKYEVPIKLLSNKT
jgi:hypothetical protein